MADNAAAFQLHLAHQGAYRLLQRQVVKLARPQPAEQASHRVIHAQRKLFNMRPALLHACVFCRQALNNARLGADGGNGLPDVIVQLAGHLLPHALFRLQQAFSQTPVARQLGLQGLIQLAQALNARPQQQPGQALGQQREQQIHRMVVPGLAGDQRDGVHQGGDQRPLPAVVPGQGDNRQRQAKRREA